MVAFASCLWFLMVIVGFLRGGQSQIPTGIACYLATYNYDFTPGKWLQNGGEQNFTAGNGANQNLPGTVARIDIYGDCRIELYFNTDCSTDFAGTISNYGNTPTHVLSGYGPDANNNDVCTQCNGTTNCWPYASINNWLTTANSTWSGISNKSYCACLDSPNIVPSSQPSSAPSVSPSLMPSQVPSGVPSSIPSPAPSSAPSLSPSSPPSTVPSRVPTVLPTFGPSLMPSTIPSASPSSTPTSVPSQSPSASPTTNPSVSPSVVPTQSPSMIPSKTPSLAPSSAPTTTPSHSPTLLPSSVPSKSPSAVPSTAPSIVPSESPSMMPSTIPSVAPTFIPSMTPSVVPSKSPTSVPTSVPSRSPTIAPSSIPSFVPSVSPSQLPSQAPRSTPSLAPTSLPTVTPSDAPSSVPTVSPSSVPTISPSSMPSAVPSQTPSVLPTLAPSLLPTMAPSQAPSSIPSAFPSTSPTAAPTVSCGVSISVRVSQTSVGSTSPFDDVYEKMNETLGDMQPNRPYYVAYYPWKKVIWHEPSGTWRIINENVTHFLSYAYSPPRGWTSYRPPVDTATSANVWFRDGNSSLPENVFMWCANSSTSKPLTETTTAAVTNAQRLLSSVEAQVTAPAITSGGIIFLAVLVASFGFCVKCMKKGGGEMKVFAAVAYGLQVLDILTDFLFTLTLWGIESSRWQWLFWVSLAFVGGPYVLNLVLLMIMIRGWRETQNVALSYWLSRHSFLLILMVAFCGACSTGVELAVSQLFYADLFCLPLRRDDIFRLSRYKLINIIFENIPQVAIQLFFILVVSPNISGETGAPFLPLLSLTLSGLGIVLFCANEFVRCQVGLVSTGGEGLHFLMTIRADGVKPHHTRAKMLIEDGLSQVYGIPRPLVEVYEMRLVNSATGSKLRIVGVVSGNEEELAVVSVKMEDSAGQESQWSYALSKEFQTSLYLEKDGVEWVSVEFVKRRMTADTSNAMAMEGEMLRSTSGSLSPRTKENLRGAVEMASVDSEGARQKTTAVHIVNNRGTEDGEGEE